MPMRRSAGGVGAAAVPEAAVPHQHAAPRHLGRDRVVRAGRSRATVGEVRAGDDPGGAVGLGEVGERPHRVAHRRRVRLGDRHELVVGVDRLRGLAGADGDRRQRRDQAAGVEHALDDRQHVGVHRHPCEDVAVHQQVVDAHGAACPRRRCSAGTIAEVDLEAVERLGQLVDQVGLDGVLDDRVALLGDALGVARDLLAVSVRMGGIRLLPVSS